MRRHDLRLLPAAIAAWAAAWLATGVPDEGIPAWCLPVLCWLLAGLVLAEAIIAERRRRFWRPETSGRSGEWPGQRARVRRLAHRWSTHIALAAACAGVAATSAGIALAGRETGTLSEAAASRTWVEVEMRLESAARPSVPAPWEEGSSSWRAPATVTAVDGRSHRPVRVEAVVSGSPSVPGFGTTHLVRVRATALPAADREAFRLRGELLESGGAPFLVGWTHPLRAGLADAADRLGGDGGALVPGLAIGDTSAVSDELREAMTVASLTHLTAVSGANCAIVTAAVTSLPWLPDAPGAALCAVGVAAGVVVAIRAGTRVRTVAAVILIVSVALPLGAAGGRPAVARAVLPADWELVQCDVGQGDAVLVRDRDAVMLVDAGAEPAALARCLDLTGIDRLDLAVITHWDADHAGGVEAIAGRVDVVLHGPLDGARSSRALEPLVRGGAEAVEVGAGASGALGRAHWRVLWPPPRTEPGNDASVVIDLRTARYRAVFLGDLGETAQERLRRDHPIGSADLVKVAHHGSADQSSELYRQLRAPVGLVGVGADNGYGHPTDSLLDLLDEAGTHVIRSDRSGTAALVAIEGGFAVWTERADQVGGDP